MARQYPLLPAEHRAALERFAAWSEAQEGRKPRKRDRLAWRDVLAGHYWPRAMIWSGESGNDRGVGSLLHEVRNWFGPEWLYKVFKLPGE